jgi:hypothetical protein
VVPQRTATRSRGRFLVGQTLDELRYSAPGNLRLVFDAGDRVEPVLYADLGPFEFVDSELGSHEVDPENPATLGPVLRTVGKQIQAVGTEGGALTLSFSDGSHLRCDPHEDYEAWQVVGGSPQHLVVCTPGGELAVWESAP